MGGADNVALPVLRLTEDDDAGVIGVDEDRGMRTALLGAVSGPVVGVVTGSPSAWRDDGQLDADRVQSPAISAMAMRAVFSSTMA
jgi:hypothetical protein